MNGAWTLAMADGGPGDVGTLTTWQLCITYTIGAPPPTNGVWTPNGAGSGLYTDAAASTVYTGTPTNQVYTRPAATTTYSVTVTNVVPSNFTLAQTSSNTITAGNSVACNAGGIHTDNSYWRVYNLASYPLGSPFTINSVQFGIEQATGGAQNVIVRLYTQTGGAFPGGTRTLIPGGTQTFVVNNTTLSLYTATFTTPPVVNTTDVIVVELFTPAQAGKGIFIGSNTAAETGPLYLNAVACGVANPVTVASLGFPNMHGILTLIGSSPGSSCPSLPRTVLVTVNTPVAITVQPVNATVCTDKVISFSVTATGTSPTYQWQVSIDAGNTFTNIANNANYSGATTNTLTITSPPTTWNGYLYRCVVSGAPPCGSVNSAQRRLTVNPLPTVSISASPYRALFPGLRTTLSATSSPAAATYTWLRNGGVLTATSLGIVSGIGTGSLQVDVDGMGTYSLRVTDVNGCTNLSTNTISITDSTSGRVFIYPNPNSGQFQVRYNPTHNNVTPRGINVYNSRGQRIRNLAYTLGLPYARMDVDLRNFGAGVYWIEVVDVNGDRLAIGRAEVLR